MEKFFTIPRLKVFSAIFSNLTAAWFILIFATRDPLTIMLNLIYSVVAWYLAVKVEEILEET